MWKWNNQHVTSVGHASCILLGSNMNLVYGLALHEFSVAQVDRAPTRCLGGHRFEFCRGLRFFLCPTLVICWLFYFHKGNVIPTNCWGCSERRNSVFCGPSASAPAKDLDWWCWPKLSQLWGRRMKWQQSKDSLIIQFDAPPTQSFTQSQTGRSITLPIKPLGALVPHRQLHNGLV